MISTGSLRDRLRRTAQDHARIASRISVGSLRNFLTRICTRSRKNLFQNVTALSTRSCHKMSTTRAKNSDLTGSDTHKVPRWLHEQTQNLHRALMGAIWHPESAEMVAEWCLNSYHGRAHHQKWGSKSSDVWPRFKNLKLRQSLAKKAWKMSKRNPKYRTRQNIAPVMTHTIRNHLSFQPTPANTSATCRKSHACHANEEVSDILHLPCTTTFQTSKCSGCPTCAMKIWHSLKNEHRMLIKVEFRKRAKRETCFVGLRACSVEMDMDISQGNFCASLRGQRPKIRASTLIKTRPVELLRHLTLELGFQSVRFEFVSCED